MQVTKDGVGHMGWLPSSDQLLLAAGDKSGKVSLWHIAPDGPAAEESDGA